MRFQNIFLICGLIAFSACNTGENSRVGKEILERPDELNDAVHQAINKFSLASPEQKRAVLAKVKLAIKNNPNNPQKRQADIADAVKAHGNFDGWAEEINKAADKVYGGTSALNGKPATMPKDVYEAIANFGGRLKYVAEKNRVILLVEQALNGPIENRDAAISASVDKERMLFGLDKEIISLLIVMKPVDMPVSVYDAIVNFSNKQKFIAAKNVVIPEIRDALIEPIVSDLAIRVSIGRHTDLKGLDDVILALIGKRMAPKPASMPQNVYDAIAKFDGDTMFIDAKNVVLPLIDAALLGPSASRNAAIHAAIGPQVSLRGLAEEIIRLLPKLLDPKPPLMPQNVYNAIAKFNGDTMFIDAKNAVLPLIEAALTGQSASRNAAIHVAIGPQVDLRGLAEEIIRLLPKLLNPKPPLMRQDVYDTIAGFITFGPLIDEKNAILPLIDAALQGPLEHRDRDIHAAIAPYLYLLGLAEDIIKLLPKIMASKPDKMSQEVYDVIVGFGGKDHVIDSKNWLLPLIESTLGLSLSIRNKTIRDLVALRPDLVGLDEEIIKMFPKVLDPKPINMPQDVYDAIHVFGGADKFIDAKNAILPLLENALKGRRTLRNEAIRNAIAAHLDLAGLAERIIDLLPKVLIAKPPTMNQGVYRVIAGFVDRFSFIDEKNTVIPLIDAAINGPIANRDNAIRAAIAAHPNLRTLDDLIIAILPLRPAEKPATMSDEIYDAIINFGGDKKFVAEKKRVILQIDAAINGPINARDQAIRDALAGEPSLAGLDDFLIARLPIKKNALMPQEIYDDIINHGGATKNIPEKNTLINAVLEAIKGHANARDAAIRAAVSAANFVGLDATIIGRLPAVVLPNKPAGMSDDLYAELILMNRMPGFGALQYNILNLIQQAIMNQPDFGAARDQEVVTQIMLLHNHVVHLKINELIPDAIKIVNNILVPHTERRVSGLVQAIYDVIVGAGLYPKDANNVIRDVALIVGTNDKAARDLAIDATIATNGARAAAGFANQLKNAVDNAQVLMARPATMEVGTFHTISNLAAISTAGKNAIVEAVNSLPVMADLFRKTEIGKIVLANGGNAGDAARISNSIPLASNFIGVLVSGDEGSSKDIDPATGNPTSFIVRVTQTSDPTKVAIGERLYLHSDRYVGEKVTHGDIIYIDKVRPTATIKDPLDDERGGFFAVRYPKIKAIQSVVGYRR